MHWEEGKWFAFAENLIDEIGSVPGAELFQQIGAMEIDGTRADVSRALISVSGARAALPAGTTTIGRELTK